MPLTSIQILKQDASYTFVWNASSTTQRWASQTLDAQQQHELQLAIQSSTQLAQQLTALLPGPISSQASPRNIIKPVAARQILAQLGQVLYNQLLPDALKEYLTSLPAPASLCLSSNSNDLPWELLHDGLDFLALQHVFSRQPMVSTAVKPPSQHTHQPFSILLLGNPTGDLPAASEEVAELADLLRLTTPIVHAELGARVTCKRVREAISTGHYSLIHYAGHAQTGELWLADGKLTLADLQRTVQTSPIAPILFLNACNSAQSQAVQNQIIQSQTSLDPLPFAGQQVANLTSALVAAGARACIGSLWPVFDQSAQQFAKDFYIALLRGTPIGEALRLARSQSWQRGRDDLAWSSFILYGDASHQLDSAEMMPEMGSVVAVAFGPTNQPLEVMLDSTKALRANQQRLQRWLRLIEARGGRLLSISEHLLLVQVVTSMRGEHDATFALQLGLDLIQDAQPHQEQAPSIGVASEKFWLLPIQSSQGSHTLYSGPAVRQACALAQAARPGTLLTTTATRNLSVKGGFSFETRAADFGQMQIDEKKIDEKIDGITDCLLVRAQAVLTNPLQPTAIRPQLRSAQMIGREEALSQLQQFWQQAQRTTGGTQGSVAGIFGVAGIGKSRLIQEFIQMQPAAHPYPSPYHLLVLQCLIVEQQTPYALLARMLRGLLQILYQDPSDLSDILAGDVQLFSLVQGILGLSAVKFDSNSEEQKKEQKSLQLRLVRWVNALWREVSKQKPLLIVIDDIHQIDESSLEILSRATDGIERIALFFVIAYRNDWEHPWLRNKAYYRPVPLQPLARDQEVALLRTLLGVEIPSERLLTLLDLVNGIPFYLEELLVWLQEQAVLRHQQGEWRLQRPLEEIQLPSTLQRLELARLQQLPEETRLLLRAASVIGEHFTLPMLTYVLGLTGLSIEEHLGELEAKQLVEFRLEQEDYRFCHLLMREVVYENLSEWQRRGYHTRAGDFLLRQLKNFSGTSNRSDRFDISDRSDRSDRLAYHFYHGRDPLVSIPHCLAAGERAANLWANLGAMTWFQRAIECLQEYEAMPLLEREMLASETLASETLASETLASETLANETDNKTDNATLTKQIRTWRMQALEGKADVLALTGHNLEAIAEYRQILTLLEEEAQDTPLYAQRCAQLYTKISTAYHDAGQMNDSSIAAEKGLASLGDIAGLEAGRLHLRLGIVWVKQGNLQQALAACQQAMTLGGDWMQSPMDLAQACNLRAIIERRLGHYQEAQTYAQQSVELYRQQGYWNGLTRALKTLGVIYELLGEWAQELACFEEALALSLKTGEERLQANSELSIGEVYRHQAIFTQAIEHFERAYQLSDEHRFADIQCVALNNMGATYLQQGDLQRAEPLLYQGWEMAKRAGIRLHECELLRHLAELHLAKAEDVIAADFAQQAQTLAQASGDQQEIQAAMQLMQKIQKN